MNEKVLLPELAELLAKEAKCSKRTAEQFLKEFFSLAEEIVSSGETLKINGLGIFKPVWVAPRASINVQTGEPFQISGHYKLSFSPDKKLRDAVNAPFAFFDTVILDVESHEVPNNEKRVSDTNTTDGNTPGSADEMPVTEITGSQEEPGEMITDLRMSEKKVCVTNRYTVNNSTYTDTKKETVSDMSVKENKTVFHFASLSLQEKPAGVRNSDTEETGDITEEVCIEICERSAQVVSEDNTPPVESIPTVHIQVCKETKEKELKTGIDENREIPVEIRPGTEYSGNNLLKNSEEKAGIDNRISSPANLTADERGRKNGVKYTLIGGFVLLFAIAFYIFRSMEIKKSGEIASITGNREEEIISISDESAIEDKNAGIYNIVPEMPVESGNAPPAVTIEPPVSTITEVITPGVFMTKIALKHYGNKVFWVYIYEENKDRIKNPNKIPVGTRLIIPDKSKYGIDASDPASVEKALQRAELLKQRFD